MYKLNGSNEEIEESIKEIDEFIEIANMPELKYTVKFFKPNTHTLVHLPEDRKNHGPLFNFTAYGYEDILQKFLNLRQSSNIRIELIVLRIQLIKYFESREVEKEIQFNCRDKDLRYEIAAGIKNLLKVTTLMNYSFYNSALIHGKK